MKILNAADWRDILVGSSFVGTGGGGRFDVAETLIQEIPRALDLKSVATLDDSELVITVFGVGGLEKPGDVESASRKNIAILENVLGRSADCLVPVEIGPLAIANAMYTAAQLDIPLIDGDLVGYRAAPEIYLEAITLNDVERLPIVASNAEGDTLCLYSSSSLESLESMLRDFSVRSASDVYVAGYPVCRVQIEAFMGVGSITYCRDVGRRLRDAASKNDMITSLQEVGCVFIDAGTIVQREMREMPGFTAGAWIIDTGEKRLTVVYKNENIVLLRNDDVVLTCPDSICLLDPQLRRGVGNSEENIGKRVLIFARRAIDAWRTRRGLELFSPSTMGLPYAQKLL